MSKTLAPRMYATLLLACVACKSLGACIDLGYNFEIFTRFYELRL